MSRPNAIWTPSFSITPKVARLLMEIEAARAEVEHIPLSPVVEAELRRQARVRSTHHSTRIEGNRLTLAEAERVIVETKKVLEGRERDVREVRHYWNALILVEKWAEAKKPVSEDLIQRLHAAVENGPRARPTPYRDGQNVIRDSVSGATVYLPPEAKDVPSLMAALARWIEKAKETDLPVPLVAALAHYQFVTIHPYYDGNGRTARLLATFLLHRDGYGLHGFLSVEEQHSRDLAAYYRALAVHPHHNYYEGRAAADLTAWTEYFVSVLARTFEAVRREARRLAAQGSPVEPDPWRGLDRRARIVLGLFARSDRISAPEVARALGLSQRMARELLKQWVEDGWLLIADPSRRARAYALSAVYRQSIGRLSAIPGE